MLTTRFIQRELAEIRRMIKQDIREELQAAFDSRQSCSTCAKDIAILRNAATGACSPAPPSVISEYDATKNVFPQQEDESSKCAVLGPVRFIAAPLADKEKLHSDNHGIPLSVLESSGRGTEPTESLRLLPITDEVYEFRMRSKSSTSTYETFPGRASEVYGKTQVRDYIASSTSSNSTPRTNRERASEVKDHGQLITDRWLLLCSGLLERTSVVHEHWMPSNSRRTVFCMFSTALLSQGKTLSDVGDGPVAWWILDPFSTRRFSWDLIGMALCVYDLVMVPVLSAFTLPSSYDTFRNVRDYFSTVFWTLDIVLSFITGSPDKDGLVEVNPQKIARKYVSTWFVFDLIIVAIDWIIVFMNAFGVSGSMRIGKAFTRVLRASRLLRILKLSEKVREVMGTVETELLFTLGIVTKQIALLFCICHYFACAWYSIGTMQNERRAWPNVFLSGNDSVLYAYAASLHYSLTLFTFGYADITPQTVSELLFVNILLVVALLVFSFFTSSVSKAISHLETVNSVQLAQDVKVRQFCSENRVPRPLMARMRNFMRQRSRSINRRLVTENDIEVFQALPVDIVRQLREHRFMRRLLVHPLFQQCLTMHPESLRAICWSGIEESFLLPSQECFPNGLDINRMIFVLTGKLCYRCCEHTSAAQDAIVLPGQWACEEALWSKKSLLLAPFVACDGSQIMLVVPNVIREIATRDMFLYDVLRSYARLFIERFNEASSDALDDCDLFNDPVTLQALVREAWKNYARKSSIVAW